MILELLYQTYADIHVDTWELRLFVIRHDSLTSSK